MHPALPFDLWPVSDRDAWASAIRPRGFLKAAGRGDAWRSASRSAAIGAYGRWLAWSSEHGGADLTCEAPAERFTSVRIRDYAAFLHERRSSVTAASHFGVLCMAVIAMFPTDDWECLRAMQRKLHQRATPTRLKRFAPTHALVQMGIELLECAAGTLDRAKDPALTPQEIRGATRDYRDGLIIALLASRPLRIKNLVEMEIGQHLRQTSSLTTIDFTSAETKTGAPIHSTWPDVLLTPLARYIREVRPMLIAAPLTGGNTRRAGEPGARLWVGQGGTALSAGGLNLALERHTERALGFTMTAHRFRDSVATSITNDDPMKVQYAAQMLGHTRTTTTERHYIAHDNAKALASYHDQIKSVRSPRTRPRP
jgi:integrase